MDYKPRIGHAILTSILSILCSVLWARFGDAMLFGAGLFLVLTISIMFSVIETAHYNSVTAYIEALVKMDSDLRNQLAFSVPSLRLVARRGEVQTLFDTTSATKEHLHLFLRDSTKTQTASRRNWHTHERPAWAYEEIHRYLLSKRMIEPVAVGPESYPWVGTAYDNLCVYFLSKSVPNLDRVFASEDF